MNMNEYQKIAVSTAIYPQGGWRGVAYCALKMNGEAGEVAEHAGKALRDDDGEITQTRRLALKKEIGDVLWYIANIAQELNFDLEDIAKSNIEKLQDRKARGVLHGSGSDR
jgi:NTP pyrophosphatase (non-canonical NTP hydrolase)